MRKNMILNILLLCLLISACNDGKENIYFNKSFDETYTIASKKGKSFCIVLVDSTKELSQRYCTYMNNERLTTNQAIYNIIDVNSPSNEWYMKWICPLSLPLTCVFSSKGELIDLIPGAAKETFLYTTEALTRMNTTKFHYPNRFNLSKHKIVSLLNQILLCKRDINQGIFISTELDNIIDSLNYPYPLYLKLVGELMENDTLASISTAKLITEFTGPYYLDSFKKELIAAKKVLNPNFDIADDPNIRVDRNMIFCNGEVNKIIPIELCIYNDGNQNLEISNILTSCTCLEWVYSSKKVIIPSKDSTVVNFRFKVDEQGKFIRDIFILSNAINIPILYIKVSANILITN